MSITEIQYVADSKGNSVGVIVPIALWREMAAEREAIGTTQRTEMKDRQPRVEERTNGASDEDVSGTMSSAERAKAYRAWAESDSYNAPLLSDEAVSRESM